MALRGEITFHICILIELESALELTLGPDLPSLTLCSACVPDVSPGGSPRGSMADGKHSGPGGGGGSGAAVGVAMPGPVGVAGPNQTAPEEGYLLIQVHVPELNVQKCLQFPRDQLVWDVKQQCLAALPKVISHSTASRNQVHFQKYFFKFLNFV